MYKRQHEATDKPLKSLLISVGPFLVNTILGAVIMLSLIHIYTNPDEKELSMVFNFHHLKVDYENGQKWTLMDFDFMELKKLFKEWQKGMEEGDGWNAVFWCNHDQPRIVSRFGDCDRFHEESAKMLATSIHLLRGTPYVYQGEEFGMPNPGFTSIEQYRDVEAINYFNILKEEGIEEEKILEILRSKSRDNGRSPVRCV